MNLVSLSDEGKCLAHGVWCSKTGLGDCIDCPFDSIHPRLAVLVDEVRSQIERSGDSQVGKARSGKAQIVPESVIERDDEATGGNWGLSSKASVSLVH